MFEDSLPLDNEALKILEMHAHTIEFLKHLTLTGEDIESLKRVTLIHAENPDAGLDFPEVAAVLSILNSYEYKS